ncbi:MAG TPA: AAA family ATPase [Gaiellaceae bacterium]|nr:AAA family ATPase [Gaiellaceae bacterium]
MDAYAVVGSYMRFGEGVREQLKDARARIAEACAQPAKRRDNHLLWAAPGSGKTYFVEQVAASLPEVSYCELNLAKLSEEAFRDGLGEAVAGGPTVCLVDEVDAKPEESWPYEVLMPFLDVNLDRGGGIVFVLAGSSGSTIDEFKDRIGARPKGRDVLSRVPEVNGWEIAPMDAGDRILVALSQMLNAASEVGRPVSGVEKLALLYLGSVPHLANARQLREFAVRAVERGSANDDRVRYDDLFDSGDPENKSYWTSVMPQAEPLVHSFVQIQDGTRKAQSGNGSRNGAHTTRLPVPATPFLGRESELADVLALLTGAGSRLVTLTGAGGTGKTRVALEAASRAAESFADGVYWVPLAPLRDDTLLAATFLQALGLGEARAQEEVIVAALAEKQALIVVDNCEHVLEGVGDLVGKLLEACPKLVVCCSSRERLGLRPERVFPVPPMTVTDAEALFVERARAVEPGFVPDPLVSEICATLDELPLAIELAAARVQALSTGAIHERLGKRLELLTTRNRDVEERQRTLEATIAWSYELLDAHERRVLRGLSVFAGGCTLAAAEAVAEADLDSLESLLDKSLIRHRVDTNGEDRYWMLETIRDYAQRELEREGEGGAAGTRHSAFFASLAESLDATDWLAVTDEQRRLVASDRANFSEAHARALATGDGATALKFVRRLGRVRSFTGVGARDWYPRVVASIALPGGTREDRAYALAHAANVAGLIGDYAQAHTWLDEAESLFEELDSNPGAADVIRTRCILANRVGDYEALFALAERLEALGESLGDDPAAAALTTRISSDADAMLGWALLGQAIAKNDAHAADRAREIFATAADAAAASGTVMEQTAWLSDLAFSLLALEAYGESITTAQRTLRKIVELEAENDTKIAPAWDCLFIVGLSLCGRDDPATGISLISATLQMWRVAGVTMAEEPFTQTLLSRAEKSARTVLGDDGYEAAVRAGEALTRDEAMELGLSVVPD